MDLKRLLKEDADEVCSSNVPLFTLQKNIDESLKNLRQKLESRREEITTLLDEQNIVCEGEFVNKIKGAVALFVNVSEIEEEPRPLLADPLPSEVEMQEFRDYIDQLKEERYNRYDKILQLREQIKDCLARLEIKVLSERDNNLVHSADLKPTCHNIDKLDQFLASIVTQYDRMKDQIEDMSRRLSQLWKYLDIPESYQQKFAKYTEVNQTTYDKLLAEVQRCEAIKKENIRVFIERVRAEIEVYWDKCLKSDAERMRFPSYVMNTFNEDVLELHEDELRDLKTFHENNEEIFNVIQERQDLWNQMESLQNKESDPKRYNNRGGQLLREEKERKMITMKLPKIEAKLLEMVGKYEEENRRPFTMYGDRINDIIERDYEAKRQEKIVKSVKKVQTTPGRTPGRANMTARTPLTVEQTIINHTAMKTTGARLRNAATKKAMSTTASSSSSVRSVYTDNGKRKLPAKVTGPIAKRQLLGAFASPANGTVLKQMNSNASRKATTSKSTSFRVYNVGTCIKRRSRKSGGKKRRSSMNRSKRPVPEIILSSEDTMTEQDATSYEGFEVIFKI